MIQTHMHAHNTTHAKHTIKNNERKNKQRQTNNKHNAAHKKIKHKHTNTCQRNQYINNKQNKTTHSNNCAINIATRTFCNWNKTHSDKQKHTSKTKHTQTKQTTINLKQT